MADEEIWRLLFDDSGDDEVFEGFEQSDRRVVEDCESDVDIDFSNVDVLPVSTPETTDDEDDEAVVQPVGAWSSTTTNIPVRNFQEPVGPVHNLPVGATPLDFLNLLLPEMFLETIKYQTNLYAEQRQQQAGKVDPEWTPVTLEEVKLFLAIGIMMGIRKLPRQKLYWSNDDALNVPAVSKLMSKNRYEKISQYLHLNDNTKYIPRGQPQHDPLFKIRPLITLTEEKFTQCYKPNRELSVDEAMVRYNGRLHFKQYIRQKPSPWGIKVWCCADPKTGYLLTYDVYTGKTNHTAPGGLGQHVVMKLSEPYLGKNHHVFFDNYFNSVPLQEELLRNNTYACGTMRVNRKEWPKDLVFNQRTPKHKRLKTGETKMKQRGDMLATVWQDKRTVAVLSTGIQPTMGSASHQTAKGLRVRFGRSPVVRKTKSNAERCKEYREALKNDPDRYKKYRENYMERNKRNHSRPVSEEEAASRRELNRLRQQKRRNKLKTEQQASEVLVSGPPVKQVCTRSSQREVEVAVSAQREKWRVQQQKTRAKWTSQLKRRNCLPRALSTIAYGKDTHHLSMRCRIVLELVNNFESYVLGNGMGRDAEEVVCHLAALAELKPLTIGTTTQEDIRETLKQKIMHIRKKGSIWAFGS